MPQMLQKLMKGTLEKLSRHLFGEWLKVGSNLKILLVLSLNGDSETVLLLTILILTLNFKDMVSVSLTCSFEWKLGEFVFGKHAIVFKEEQRGDIDNTGGFVMSLQQFLAPLIYFIWSGICSYQQITNHDLNSKRFCLSSLLTFYNNTTIVTQLINRGIRY